MNVLQPSAAGRRHARGRRILDVERTEVVIPAKRGSTRPAHSVDIAPLLGRSIGTIVLALAVKLAAATVIAAMLGVRTHIQRMWVLPVLAYDTGGRAFAKITSRSTLAMAAVLVFAFLATLVRHSRQQRIAGSAVGVLAATNALLVDLVLERTWGNYVENSTVRWNLLVLGAGWLLVGAWLAIDRPWHASQPDGAPESSPAPVLPG